MINFPIGPPWDAAYTNNVMLYHNQAGQVAKNLAVHDAFVQAKANWILQNTQNQGLGLTLSTPPPVPVQTIYNDDGSISNPPFTDLTPAVLPETNTAPSKGLFVNAVPLQGGMTVGETNIMGICQEILARTPAPK